MCLRSACDSQLQELLLSDAAYAASLLALDTYLAELLPSLDTLRQRTLRLKDVIVSQDDLKVCMRARVYMCRS